MDVYNLSTDHRCTVLSKHIQKAQTSEKEKYTVQASAYHRTSQDTGYQSSKEKPVRECWARTAARNEDTGPCLNPVHSLAGLTGGARVMQQQCVTEATEGERGPSSLAEVAPYGGNLKGKEAGSELGQMRQNPWCSL